MLIVHVSFLLDLVPTYLTVGLHWSALLFILMLIFGSVFLLLKFIISHLSALIFIFQFKMVLISVTGKYGSIDCLS